MASRSGPDTYGLPPAPVVRLASLGYRRAMADVVWVKSLLYVSSKVARGSSMAHGLRYAKLVVLVDPTFRRAYRWASVMGAYRSGQVQVDSLREAVALLRRGVVLFPEDGTLAWELGSTVLFEWIPHVSDGRQRRRLRLEAVRHLDRAVKRGAGPPWLALVGAREMERMGQLYRALRMLVAVEPFLKNERVIARLQRRKRQLAAQLGLAEPSGKTR